MKKAFYLSAACIAVFLIVTNPAQATPITGSLSLSDGGITGDGDWVDSGDSSISWTITQNPDDSWHYSYTLSVADEPRIKDFIIETAADFTSSDIFNATGDFDKFDIKTHNKGPKEISMPESFFGIKFKKIDEDDSTIVTFDSLYAPGQGDFYAKGDHHHNKSDFVNAGFLVADTDNNINMHIMAPMIAPPIPEPATFTLLALSGLTLIRRKKRS